MERKEIETKVYNIIADKLQIGVEEVKDNSIICSDLGADKLDVIDIVIKCEDYFDIYIDESFYTFNITVKGICDIVEKLIKERWV